MKKELKKLDKEELIEIILDLYKKHKPVKDYLNLYINPDEKKLLAEYRDRIFHSYYPKRGLNFKLKDAKKAINDFKKLSPSPEILADLMLFYVECGVDFTNDYGDIDGPYYTNLEKTYVEALTILRSKNCLDKFQDRANKISSNSEGIGWGFGDYMLDVYYDFYQDEI